MSTPTKTLGCGCGALQFQYHSSRCTDPRRDYRDRFVPMDLPDNYAFWSGCGPSVEQCMMGRRTPQPMVSGVIENAK